LSRAKLDQYSKLTTSLQPGTPGALKARTDGTVIDGHHRLRILQDRGVNINELPREILSKEDLSS
jgi:hypothetical protein